MVYNEAVFEEVGIDPADIVTWANMFDACQKLAERILREPYDLILFGYELVFPDPSKNSVQLPGHPEDSFDLSAHPEYLVHCTPYPWDKLIGRSLLSKVSFPEGLRFEDIPAIFPAAASASHAGVIREAFYHYRRNVGFLDRISEGTLDIVPALRLFRKNMEELGLLSRFAPEVEYLVIRHCFHRLRKLLFDNSRDNIPLKLRISNACFDYLEQDYPDWKKNPLLPVYFPDYLKRPWYFYSSRRHMNTRILLSVLPWKKQVRYVEEKTRQNPFTGF